MPNFHVPLPETEQNITRPIVISIVSQVEKIMKLKPGSIYYPDESGKMANSDGTIDSSQDRYAKFTSSRINFITVEESIDEEEISPTYFDGKEYPPVIADTSLGLVVSPVYVKYNVLVEFNYQCPSETEAKRWLADMRMKLALLRDINIHTVDYSYNLNREIMDVVKVIYQLRESNAGYGQSFREYLLKHSTNRLTRVSDMVGQNVIFAVSESQTEIYGLYDFDSLPEAPTKNTDTGMWTISFGYRYNYDKPVGSNIRYPIIVHNKLMPLEYVDQAMQSTRAIERPTDMSRTQDAFSFFRSDRMLDAVHSNNWILKAPMFDDYMPQVQYSQTAVVVQALAVIEPEDPRLIMNLNDLDDIVIDEDVMEFIRESEYKYLAKPYLSLFNVSVYSNMTLLDHERIYVDKDLNVYSRQDLDMRRQYRVRLAVATDMGFVKCDAIKRVRDYPKALSKIVSTINIACRERPEMNEYLSSKRLSDFEFSRIFRSLSGNNSCDPVRDTGFDWGGVHIKDEEGITDELLREIKYSMKSPKTVMVTGVMAFRRDDPAGLDPNIGPGNNSFTGL